MTIQDTVCLNYHTVCLHINRYVWDVIEASKPGRVIVLTTHSMEEADVLGDKVAIMARGKLRCIGTSLRLKQRFGGGYYVSGFNLELVGCVPCGY